MKGRTQVADAVKTLNEIGFSPSFIWVSNTERAYETAVMMARELQLGQNRIIPEYSFLDARAAGTRTIQFILYRKAITYLFKLLLQLQF